MRPSYFEAVTAAAFRWFADVAVDVAVIEVGLLGRWDATNVCDAQVAVVTNIGIDHTEFAGPTKAHIAREKSGIVKPGSAVVIGETDPELVAIFAERRRRRRHLVRGERLRRARATSSRSVAVWSTCARRPRIYPEVFVPLHGRHQADNAAVRAHRRRGVLRRAAARATIVDEGFAAVVMPGRFEVLGHQPLVIVDGAHNPAGADVVRRGVLRGLRSRPAGAPGGRLPARPRPARDAVARCGPTSSTCVLTCTAPSPAGLPAAELTAAAARSAATTSSSATTVEQACRRGVRRARRGRHPGDRLAVRRRRGPPVPAQRASLRRRRAESAGRRR